MELGRRAMEMTALSQHGSALQTEAPAPFLGTIDQPWFGLWTFLDIEKL